MAKSAAFAPGSGQRGLPLRALLLVLPFAAAARLFKANDERVLPIGMWFDTPLSIVVNAKLPARNLGDLLDSAKQAGRKLVMLNSLCKSKSRTRCGCQSRPRHSLSKSSGRLPSTCLDSTPTRASQQSSKDRVSHIRPKARAGPRRSEVHISVVGATLLLEEFLGELPLF